MSDFINDLDRAALLWLHARHHPALTPVMMAASYAGEAAACWWALGGLFALRRHPLAKTMLLAFLLTSIIGVIFTNLPQVLWFRPRPYLYIEGVHQLGFKWENSAFPSGHTVNSFGGAVIFGRPGRFWRVGLLLFAALMGVSRVYAGMHHPSDVAFAAMAGALCGLVSWKMALAILAKMERRRRGAATASDVEPEQQSS